MAHINLPKGCKAVVVIPFGDRDGDKEPDASVMLFEVVPDTPDGKSQPARLRFETGPVNAPITLAEQAAMLAADGLAPAPAKLPIKMVIKLFVTAIRGLIGL